MVVVLRLYMLEQCPELNFGHQLKLVILLLFYKFLMHLGVHHTLLLLSSSYVAYTSSVHGSNMEELFGIFGVFLVEICSTMVSFC